MVRNKICLYLIIFFLLLTRIITAQIVEAKINVDDYQWYYSENDPMNFQEIFSGSSLTAFYAPLPVFFQGWESSPRESIADYVWNFGDNSPVFYGFNAGHVYEIPGNYNVSLTVIDSLGNSDTDHIEIIVLERDGVVYYVDSELGNDSNNGLSQEQTGQNIGPWKTADKAITEMSTDLYHPGDCILFKRGQIFELTVSEVTLDPWPSWGYMFGSYSSGDKPVIQYSGLDNADIIHQYSIGLGHIAFVDLEFRFDDYGGHRAGTFFFAQGGGTRNILFLRVDAIDLYSNLFVIGRYDEGEIGTGTFLVDSSIHNTYIDPLQSVTQFGLWASRFVCLNNNFDLSGNHIGYTAIDKGVIAGNSFSRPAFGRTALRICGFQEENEDWNPNLTSNNVQVSDNYFRGWIDPETTGSAHNGGGDSYNYNLVQLAPNGNWNQIIENITFERNVITNGLGMMTIGAAENIIVRNNILISNNQEAPSYLINIVDANKPCKNINIIGNTLVARNTQFSGNIYEMSAMINIFDNSTQIVHPYSYTNHENINIYNNIFYINGNNDFSRCLLVDNIDEVLPEVHSDNNLFYVDSGTETAQIFQIGSSLPSVDDAQYLDFESWKLETNNDINSTFGNPHFIDLNGIDGLFSGFVFDADLSLQESSNARLIGKVDKVNSYLDYYKNHRLNDSYVDIGATEYSDEVILEAPGNVEISFEGNHLLISWDEVIGANSYEVYFAEYPNGSYTLISDNDFLYSHDNRRVIWSTYDINPKGFFYVKAVDRSF